MRICAGVRINIHLYSRDNSFGYGYLPAAYRETVSLNGRVYSRQFADFQRDCVFIEGHIIDSQDRKIAVASDDSDSCQVTLCKALLSDLDVF